jgi:hypothetical protein
MRAAARLLVTVPAVALVGWTALNALRIGTADATVFEAGREMATWGPSRSRPGAETIRWVHDDLQRAAAHVPGDPTAHELTGVLMGLNMGRPEYRGESLVHFAKALALRPTSPYTWANIAELKYRIGETDALFESALQRALHLGPAEPEVQRTVADYGLAVWKEVTPNTREAINRAVKGAAIRNPLETLQIAGRRGRLDVACRHLTDSPRRTEPKWSRLCPSTEATP